MIGPNGMVGYDIVLGRVTYSYGIEFTPIKISSFALRSSTPSATMRVMCSLTVTSTSVTICLGIPAGIYNSPGTYNWDVAGYINKYGETYSSTSVNNSDYDSCGCIISLRKKLTIALRTSATTAAVRTLLTRMVASSSTTTI